MLRNFGSKWFLSCVLKIPQRFSERMPGVGCQLHAESVKLIPGRSRIASLVEPASSQKASQGNPVYVTSQRAFDPAPPPWALRPNNLK